MGRRVLLVTANVGSLFEAACRLQPKWLDTMAQKIESERPDVCVIHMQETGGKHFEECSAQVPVLLEQLHGCLAEYTMRAYLDLDYPNLEEYTALGSILLVRTAVLSAVKLFDFQRQEFVDVPTDTVIYTKDFHNIPEVIKTKFPKHFWPAIKWGRKGYLHLRLRTDDKIHDFVNCHLFHDESNLALIHENPSLYSSNRKRALDYVLEQIEGDSKTSPSNLFIFGDLNFRLNSPSFVNRLTESTERFPVDDDTHGSVVGLKALDDMADPLSADPLRRTVSAIEFRHDEKQHCVLRIEKKRFDYFNHKKLLNEWQNYLEDDCESHAFPQLHELPIAFPPTYPWSEDPDDSDALMKTRAPAWCDRVLMNGTAYRMVSSQPSKYDSFGREICTGDHKPVFLSFTA